MKKGWNVICAPVSARDTFVLVGRPGHSRLGGGWKGVSERTWGIGTWAGTVNGVCVLGADLSVSAFRRVDICKAAGGMHIVLWLEWCLQGHNLQLAGLASRLLA